MVAFVVKRLLIAVPLLILISLISFSTLYFADVDPARVIAGEKASPDTVERMRKTYHFDKPFAEQYLLRARSLLTEGSFGDSLITRRPVEQELSDKFPATVELALAAMVIATFFGVLFGILSAVFQRTVVDYSSLALALVGVSIPVFFLGILLVIIFSGWLGLFPVSGRYPIGIVFDYDSKFYVIESFLRGDWGHTMLFLKHLTLPAIALATIPLAVITRITRSSMLDVLKSDYIRTAQAKGLSQFAVIFKHALRNAMIQITTISGAQLGYLFGGAVLTESVFDWPGLGKYLVERVEQSDFMALQGGLFITASAFVLINLLVDVSYALIDPRVSYDEGQE